jgi:alkylation response protein AidB-like acyl-CoA dehydrogenase
VIEVKTGSGSTEAALRAEVRSWLAEHWSAERSPSEFLAEVVDEGWACPTWPRTLFGRGLPVDLAAVVGEEFTRAGAPGGGQTGTGRSANPIAADLLMALGTDVQRERLMRPLLLGDIGTCLLYSEPGAGSDLASLQTRAEQDGDEWVVNGQKVWTTLAHQADYGLLLARTNWDVPKHRGITLFLLPMRQEGVDVRPLRQITGDREFNEVFLTDARVPQWAVVGDVNDGWRVLQTALASERSLMGSQRPSRGRAAAASAPSEEGGADYVVLARDRGRDRDPLVRQEIARLEILRRINRWNGERARIALEAGRSSPLASLGKLAMSEILHSAARLNQRILGAEAMLMAPSSERSDLVNRASMTAFINSIGGGSDQIQRNIIGERVLGLSREPEVDKDVPFRDVPKAAATLRFS